METNDMKRNGKYLTAISTLLIIVLTLTSFSSIRADNPPGNPYSVYGYVTLNGNPAPAGVKIILSIKNKVDHFSLTNAKAQYTIDFDAMQGQTANFTVYVYNKYIVPTDNQSFQINHPSPYGYFINLSVTASPSQNGSNQGSTSGGTSISNKPPIADASAGEPYQGYVNEPILFNGSKSHDPDGHIIAWSWSFGDGSNGTGEIAPHTYTQEGTYTVVLTVTDNNGATDNDTTTAVILSANNPPTAPTLTGGPSVSGHKGVSYDFEVMSTDADNDLIKYIITWGDGNTSTTDFFPSGVPVVQPHTWAVAGQYTISATAWDGKTESVPSTTVAVLMDAMYVGGFGYLVDTNGDGTYDVFHSNSTGTFTAVKLRSDGKYLIDTNGDSKWDIIFDPLTKQWTVYKAEAQMQTALMILGGILGLILVLFLIIVLLSRRKKPRQVSSPAPGAEAGNPEKTPSKKSSAKKPQKPAK
jgi:PKD repeat protein